MEDRRRSDDKNWQEIKSFIGESREYRAADIVTQKYQVENIEALKNAVKIQNGRVYKLEEWQVDMERKIKQQEDDIKLKKDNHSNFLTIAMVLATVIMAVTSLVVLFRK